MNHRKIMHIQTVALCRNKLEGNCNFIADICWWNHEETQNNHVVKIACYICNESFSSKVEIYVGFEKVRENRDGKGGLDPAALETHI